jgi:hypothetical protein
MASRLEFTLDKNDENGSRQTLKECQSLFILLWYVPLIE